MMLCGSFLCNFVHFFIRTHANDNHQHSRFRALNLINDAYSSGAQLDFQLLSHTIIISSISRNINGNISKFIVVAVASLVKLPLLNAE